jgi:RNA polymerase sigma-70 factor, ECF subfamily
MTDDPADPAALSVALARISAGDHAAFERLYRATSAKLFAIALRTTGNRDSAEEVLQEVFTAIWQNAARYDPHRGAPMAWLTTMVRHAAIDRLRRGAVRGEGREAPEEALLQLPASAASAADRGVMLSALNRCLETLEAPQRRAILLAYTQGYTHEELASALATPLGTIKSWVRRGLERLKRCLDG